MLLNPGLRLKLIMWAVGFHSLCVGLSLIFIPSKLLLHFGFNPICERFFTVQGGVLHIVMSVAYFLAGNNLEKRMILVFFSIIAKFIATIFLFSYYFIVDGIWTVLLSGVVDAVMGFLILWGYMDYSRVKGSDKHA